MARNKKNVILLSVLIVLLVLITVAACMTIHFRLLKEAALRTEQPEPDGVTDTLNSMNPDEINEAAEAIEIVYIEDGGETEDGGYECPTALKKAMEKNPDVYAWLSVTDTEITYPICNRPRDNKYYLNHSSEPLWNPMGALFTEDYNSRDFTDPCVVVYGHSMTGTRFFGTLQKNYSDRKFFDEHREIKVYLPDKVLTYKVFAATAYSNVHILYYYDFTSESYYNWFIKSFQDVRELSSIIDKDAEPEFDDKLLVLSTCLKGYNNKRFLVIAVLEDSSDMNT